MVVGYTALMAVSGGSSLLLGRLFDRYRFKLLIGLTLAAAPFAPLVFLGGYGVFWFLGSASIGFLYDRSIVWAITFCVVAQLAAIPLFIWVAARQPARAALLDTPAKENTP